MLLPTASKQIYNLQSKQLIKLFSKLFNANQSDMATHLELGTRTELYIKISIHGHVIVTMSPIQSTISESIVDLFVLKVKLKHSSVVANCSILNALHKEHFE